MGVFEFNSRLHSYIGWHRRKPQAILVNMFCGLETRPEHWAQPGHLVPEEGATYTKDSAQLLTRFLGP